MDQMAMVLSAEAEASQREQLEKLTAFTVALCSCRTARGLSLFHCHTRTRRSHPPEARSLPSGLTHTEESPPLPLASEVSGIVHCAVGGRSSVVVMVIPSTSSSAGRG